MNTTVPVGESDCFPGSGILTAGEADTVPTPFAPFNVLHPRFFWPDADAAVHTLRVCVPDSPSFTFAVGF